MSDRISTTALYTQGLTAMLRDQASMARTQLQMSAGTKLLTAADDPVGAGLGIVLDRANAQLDSYAKNATSVSNRLNLEESALSSVGDRVSRIRELAIEASNDTQSADSRAAIVAQLKQEYSGLVADANSGDGTGRYLFGGSQDTTAPFSVGAGGVSYQGDQTQRSVQISTSIAVADSDAGSEVFMRVPTGNGSFAARASGTNSGTLAITASQQDSATAYDGGSYRVTFDGAGGYQVLDAASTVVSGGSYAPGQAISFRGADLTFSGQPAAGDSFTVQPAPKQDIFATVQQLIDTTGAKATTPAQQAAQRNGFFAAIENLGHAETHVLDTRASLGARLQTLDETASERSAQTISIKSTLSDLRDVDYTQAASQLSLQTTALQAAQLTFQKVQSLSLFNLLK
jgi:flagellar hook-associated protein 3 FlgL